jgi:pimeloyl-ACP methyl ester carboxylesterase
VPDVNDHEGELDGRPVFWRSASLQMGANGASSTAHGSDAAVPLYVHGVPDSSDAWLEFLARSGGLAPDLPGFGRSGKPGSLSYTIEEYADFLEAFLELVGVERVKLVLHDWGAVGLAFAQRHPERVERLVAIDVVPFMTGYRWHRTARMWRTPLLGELSMGTINKRVLSFISRESNATPGPMPEAWQQSVLAHFDQGTQRAILRLYRSSPPEVLVQAGARLHELDMPALVVWGAKDPYIPARFAQAYVDALPNAELLELADAGHWVWFDRPDVIERVVEFLGREPE